MLDSLLRLLSPEKPQERRSLEIENVLLTHFPPLAIPAGEHIRDLVRHPRLVIGRLPRFMQCERRIMQVAYGLPTERRDAPWRWRHVVRREIQNARLRVRDQLITVHR